MSARFQGKAFFLNPAGRRAVLLVHGFTASTQEMEALGQRLAMSGYAVRAVLLAGHNEDFAAFRKTTADSYFSSVREAYQELKAYESVDVVGLSFGSALALRLALDHPVRKVVALAPLIFYRRWSSVLSPLLAVLYRGRAYKKNKFNPTTGLTSRWDLFKPEAIRERLAYPWLAFPQLQSTRTFTARVRKNLSRLSNPLLLIHSRRDRTASARGARLLFDRAASPEKSFLWLETSGHIITEDYEAERVGQEVIKFLGTA